MEAGPAEKHIVHQHSAVIYPRPCPRADGALIAASTARLLRYVGRSMAAPSRPGRPEELHHEKLGEIQPQNGCQGQRGQCAAGDGEKGNAEGI